MNRWQGANVPKLSGHAKIYDGVGLLPRNQFCNELGQTIQSKRIVDVCHRCGKKRTNLLPQCTNEAAHEFALNFLTTNFQRTAEYKVVDIVARLEILTIGAILARNPTIWTSP